MVNSGGTIKAARQILLQNGWASPEGFITKEAAKVRDVVLAYKR